MKDYCWEAVAGMPTVFVLLWQRPVLLCDLVPC